MSTDTKAVTLRVMRWWDVAAVQAIEAEVFPGSAWSLEMFWAELAGVPDTRWYCVAVAAGSVVGYGGLMTVGPEADVQTIAVEKSCQGLGIGRSLLSTLLTEAARRGCARILLEVAADNLSAQHLYSRHDFAVIAQRRNYYSPGHDALVMSRSLLGGMTP